jgi:hypothetical protein
MKVQYLKTVVLPATVREIDPAAFDAKVCPLFFEGWLPLFGRFAHSVEIPAGLEVLGPDAFTGSSFGEG